MQYFFFDLRFVLRQLRKSPGFAMTAVLMLAFGIGATTAIFSIVEGVLLRPLPFPDPSRLVVLADHLEGADRSGDGSSEAGVTVPDIRAYTRETNSFTALGGYAYFGYELSGAGEAAQINATRLTSGVFPALGVQPQLGRFFTADEDEQSQPVAVLSYATWKNRFNANPHVLGTKILLDRKPYIVIGVMPRSFEFPLVPGQLNRTELWVPMSFAGQELTPLASASWNYRMVGRLKPGISPQQAQIDAERVAQDIMRNYPAMMASLRISALVRPLQEQTVAETRPLLRTLFLAVVVVLLIACVNLAGLMLVRAIRRQREIAVRLALGAGAFALLRQAILESLILSVFSGLLGLAGAGVALRIGRSLLPESLPRIEEISLNWAVVGFALLLAVVTGLLCGLVPAFAALRTNVNGTLKEGGRSGTVGGGHARLRSTLVVAEIAIALVLLAASGLLLRSFEKMRSVDLGFRPDHVATANYSLPVKQYSTQPAVDAFNSDLLRRLRQIPGIQAAGLTSLLPASGNSEETYFVVEGYVAPQGVSMNEATPTFVIGDYFRAMSIPVLHGRTFTEADKTGAQLVIIVNHKFAQHYWPNQDPIGRRIRVGTAQMKTPWTTVVGEVADVKEGSPDSSPYEQFYWPVAQTEEDIGELGSPGNLVNNGGFIVMRSPLPPEQMESALRATVRAIDPQLPLTQVETMEEVISESEAPRRFNTALITGFAVAAVLLAVLGIYSVIAFSIASRVQEMAIRMALGSERAGIVRLVLESGVKLAAIGCILGLAGAAAASTLLRSLLFDVSPFDPLVLTAAALGILLLAVAASVPPALRAASIQPVQALRRQ
jgi:putative ABC transport system permease protein